MTEAVRATVEVVGWDDQDYSGASLEAGFDARDWFAEGSRTVFVVIASFAQFEDVVGARASFGRSFRGRGRWDVLYEFTFHHAEEYNNDRIDVYQHRIRASASMHLDGGWDIAAHVEVFMYVETFWTLGFNLQKRF
jgi:hypothetical protein